MSRSLTDSLEQGKNFSLALMVSYREGPLDGADLLGPSELVHPPRHHGGGEGDFLLWGIPFKSVVFSGGRVVTEVSRAGVGGGFCD